MYHDGAFLHFRGGKDDQLKNNPDDKVRPDAKAPEEDAKDVLGGRQAPPAMSRKDSFGDLLLHLPRIASLPKFLFGISEED